MDTPKFPHHRDLHKLLLEWMQEEEAKIVIPIVKHIIEIDNRDSWGHRELARWLIQEKRPALFASFLRHP